MSASERGLRTAILIIIKGFSAHIRGRDFCILVCDYKEKHERHRMSMETDTLLTGEYRQIGLLPRSHLYAIE